MTNHLRNTRIAVRLTLPLLLLAAVALGGGGFAGWKLTRTDTQIVNLPGTVWRALALPDPQATTLALRQLEENGRFFPNHASPVRDALEESPAVAILTEIGQRSTPTSGT